MTVTAAAAKARTPSERLARRRRLFTKRLEHLGELSSAILFARAALVGAAAGDAPELRRHLVSAENAYARTYLSLHSATQTQYAGGLISDDVYKRQTTSLEAIARCHSNADGSLRKAEKAASAK